MVCTHSWCCGSKRNSKKKKDMAEKGRGRVDKVDVERGQGMQARNVKKKKTQE